MRSQESWLSIAILKVTHRSLRLIERTLRVLALVALAIEGGYSALTNDPPMPVLLPFAAVEWEHASIAFAAVASRAARSAPPSPATRIPGDHGVDVPGQGVGIATGGDVAVALRGHDHHSHHL
jgi:hypothetical protein